MYLGIVTLCFLFSCIYLYSLELKAVPYICYIVSMIKAGSRSHLSDLAFPLLHPEK